MKFVFLFLLIATLASAQTAKPATSTHRHPETAQSRATTTPQDQAADMNALFQDELPNMKSDLAELRALLNVMASQEMSLDTRTNGAFQTNRQMWQVVIARLAELTQRMDALERNQGHPIPRPHPQQP